MWSSPDVLYMGIDQFLVGYTDQMASESANPRTPEPKVFNDTVKAIYDDPLTHLEGLVKQNRERSKKIPPFIQSLTKNQHLCY
jgi:hypothetical protein